MWVLGIQAHISWLLQVSPTHCTICSALHFTFEAGSYVDWPQTMQLKNNLELRILLAPPSKYWEYTHVSLHPLYMVLGVEPGASCRWIYTPPAREGPLSEILCRILEFFGLRAVEQEKVELSDRLLLPLPGSRP